MDQPRKVANPARGQLNRENNVRTGGDTMLNRLSHTSPLKAPSATSVTRAAVSCPPPSLSAKCTELTCKDGFQPGSTRPKSLIYLKRAPDNPVRA